MDTRPRLVRQHCFSLGRRDSALLTRQNGAIPLIVVVALALAALAGGAVGFSLGDGTMFSFGVGFGLAFFLIILFAGPIKRFVDLKKHIDKK